mmetsp:Transcript_1411/g.2857  ORF Transcript_1411/g.2857 Transcript_1411/m.2857 type:complete len:872 (+) Transcript_1411:98-2713(+)
MDFVLLPISKDALEWQCSILKLGGLTVLLNCGWTESFDVKLLAPLIPHLTELDLIVLTHADMKHLGALPYILSKYSVTCPIVCTEPVSRLGELSCVSCLEDREKYREASDAYEVDEVLRIFMSRITPLKYRETFRIQAAGRVLAACPYPAGSNLGSAYWTFHCGSMSAIYIVDCNMRQGRYLDGLELERILPACRGAAQRWDVVITAPLATPGLTLPEKGAEQGPKDVYAASKAMTCARTVKEQLFLEETIAALRQGGTVLIPADVAGWIPEVLLLFEAAWSQDRQLATSYPLVWLSSMGDMVLDQVKTRLEYMGNEVLNTFESRTNQHPFALKHVRIFQSLEELCAAHPLSRPKVIFSTSPHLEGGDSRELFFRLCSEPRNLLWLLGISSSGTLARQLLDDFVIGQCLRKDYRLQQHIKEALPDEELRAFYETKMQETEMEPPPPPDLGLSMKAEDILSVAKEEPGKVKEEDEAKIDTKKLDTKLDSKKDIKVETTTAPGEARGKSKREPQRSLVSSALWSPLGWPSSRTLAHNEVRTESDEYGHLLTPAELRGWRAQDQEGNKYSNPSGADDAETEGRIKEETKLEEEMDLEVGTSEWRESLRLHFREPMRTELREKMVKVSCKVRHLPDNSLSVKDLSNLLQLACPRHVALLPARSGAATTEILRSYFASSSSAEDSYVPPEVHALTDVALQLPLRGLKRKIQFSNELWPQLTFQKTADDIRIARVRASPTTSDPRLLELGLLEDDRQALEGVPSASQGRLPRGGCLFVGLGAKPIRLSGIKESLLAAEWQDGMEPEIEFRAPPAQSKRSWSARVLTAGTNKAALGWVRKGRQKDSTSASPPLLRLEGVPCEEFFVARAALYKRSAII